MLSVYNLQDYHLLITVRKKVTLTSTHLIPGRVFNAAFVTLFLFAME